MSESSDPNPNEEVGNAVSASQKNNRRQLLLIAVIAAISVGGSYALYFRSADGGVWGTTNQGEFVQPAMQAAELALQDNNFEPAKLGEVWWVWLVDGQGCVGDCPAILDKMRAMHVLLHKDADRLRRAWVRPAGSTGNAAIATEFPKLKLFQSEKSLKPGLYIVDPLGNLVFYYRNEQMGKPLLQDLKRLLKVSQIG